MDMKQNPHIKSSFFLGGFRVNPLDPTFGNNCWIQAKAVDGCRTSSGFLDGFHQFGSFLGKTDRAAPM